MISDFALEWGKRYLEKVCTLNHLDRLLAINKLTEEEYRYIININKEEGDDQWKYCNN